MSQLYIPEGTSEQVVRNLDLGEREMYKNDPALWAEEKLGLELWSFNHEVLNSIRQNRDTAVQSSHGPGKSFTASVAAAWWLDVHPVGEAFVITTAPTADQVYAVLWREMRHRKREGELDGRITLDAKWYLSDDGEDELVAMGRKPSDYNPAAFQGIHARFILLIMDEACGIPKTLYVAGKSLVTTKHSRRLAIGNPDDPASEFAKVCAPGSTWHTIQMGTFDTPAFTDEDVSDELLELMPTEEWVEECKIEWGETSPTYQSKVLGLFPEIGDDTLFPPAILRKAIDNEDLPGLAIGQLGVDVARYGSDKTCIYRNRDGVIREVRVTAKTSTADTKNFVQFAITEQKHKMPAVIDVIGVGAGVYDMLKDEGFNVKPFNASNAPNDKERYLNRRAEVYWEFRVAMDKGEVDLDPDDNTLLAQLGSMKFKYSKGRIQIEGKDKMKERGLPSPDRADAAVMSWAKGRNLDLDAFTKAHEANEVEGIMDDILDRPM